MVSDFGRELLSCAVAGVSADEHPLRHVADLPPRSGQPEAWPRWAHPDVVRAFVDRGVRTPWSHQREAADLAHDGRHVVLSTGTASGKSLAYQLPILSAMASEPRTRALYLSPTKALGHDQLRTAQALTDAVPALRDVAPASYDGDSPVDVRRFARERSRWIFSNPDMIHLSLLRNHARWAVFLRHLRFIVVDECHYYRGFSGPTWRWCCAGCCGCARATHPTADRRSSSRARPPPPRRDRRGADRPNRHRGHRRRLTAGRAHGGAVGAGAADRSGG